MIDYLAELIGNYYGLDWMTLICGVTASYMISNAGRLYTGLCFGLCACACGLSVAVLSGQNGFILYNTMLIAINARGLYLGFRRNFGRPPALE